MPDPKLKDLRYYCFDTDVMHGQAGERWDAKNVKVRDLLVEAQDLGEDTQGNLLETASFRRKATPLLH